MTHAARIADIAAAMPRGIVQRYNSGRGGVLLAFACVAAAQGIFIWRDGAAWFWPAIALNAAVAAARVALIRWHARVDPPPGPALAVWSRRFLAGSVVATLAFGIEAAIVGVFGVDTLGVIANGAVNISIAGGVAARASAVPRIAKAQVVALLLPDALVAVCRPGYGYPLLGAMLVLNIVGVFRIVDLLAAGLRDLMAARGAQQRLINELAKRNRRFDTAIDAMGRGFAMLDAEGLLIVTNRRLRELLGLGPAPDAAGLSRALDEAATDGGRALDIVSEPMADGGRTISVEDVTERRDREARIAHLARHDVLTELPNRLLLRLRLQDALARLRRDGEPFALLCLDLDRFKLVNDTLGHLAGDAVLQAVARRITVLLRATDTAARFGGDEFVILLAGADRAGAEALAVRLIDDVSMPYDLDAGRATIGVSAGIAAAPADGTDIDALLRRADLALYAAKAGGRGACRLFHADIETSQRVQQALDIDLRGAIDRCELTIVYQPIIDLGSGAVVSVEALLRWSHPTLGEIEPSRFIPLAEESSLIGAVGAWVLERACSEIAPLDGLRLAVNISAVQLRQPGMIATLRRALDRSGLSADRLDCELTESATIEPAGRTLEALRAIRNEGPRVVLDDFGTAYASLANLRRLPLDAVKIDRSFVHGVAGDQGAGAIVSAVLELGRQFSLEIIAEGIETDADLAFLRREGCRRGQGYLFARPMAPDSLPKILAGKPLGRWTPRIVAGR